MTQEGRVLKGVGGFYTVRSEEGALYTCMARGKFRKEKLTPTVGDYVEFDPGDAVTEGYLLRILPRKNLLRRPPVSNVDLVAVVIAWKDPDPDMLLADRLLAQAEEWGLEAALVINKCDLAEPEAVEDLAAGYRHLAGVLPLSARTGAGVDALRPLIRGKTFCVAGASGVGKSSLLRYFAGEELAVGSVSRRLGRGRHTTRHVELFPTGDGGYVVDTPGFSLLEMDPMDPLRLAGLYPDFFPYRENCRFVGCRHLKEPGCGVKAAVQDGHIHPGRYQRYVQLMDELEEMWRNRYE